MPRASKKAADWAEVKQDEGSAPQGTRQDPATAPKGRTVTRKAEQSQATEGANLTRQLQETRHQLDALQEECRQMVQELEEFRRQSHTARAELLAAQQEFVHATLEGVRRMREELAAAGGEVLAVKGLATEANQYLLTQSQGQSEALQQQFGVAWQQLEEIAGQANRTWLAVQTLREENQEAAREAKDLRVQSRNVQKEFLASRQLLHETLQGFLGQAREQVTAVEEQVEQLERHSLEAGQRLQEEFEGQARDVRLELGEARRAIQDLPQKAEGSQARLEQLVERLEEVEQKLRQPADDDETARNRLGVTVVSGVVVADVLPGTPAAEAGLARGDVIAGVNGMPVLSGAELRDLIQEMADDEAITLQFSRGDTMQEYSLRLRPLPSDEETPSEERNRLGLTVAPGVVLAEVAPETPAAAAGLARGDLVTHVNAEPVHTGEQLRLTVQPLPEHAEVTLRVTRSGEEREVTLRLDDAT